MRNESAMDPAVKSAVDLGRRFIAQHGDHLGYLRDRWSDEKEYEDWADYEKSMREVFGNFVILRVVKVGVVLSDGVSEITIKALSTKITMSVKKKG